MQRIRGSTSLKIAVFQPYRDMEAGDYQSLKFKWRGRISNPGPFAPQAKSLTTRPTPLPITMITGINTMTNKQMANYIFKVYESETDKIQIYFWQIHTYTNGKKKRCSAKMLITRKICSGWARKFINMVFLIHTFTYQTFMRFHVRLVRHLFFLWKLLFVSSVQENNMQQNQLMQNVSLWSIWCENHFTFVN